MKSFAISTPGRKGGGRSLSGDGYLMDPGKIEVFAMSLEEVAAIIGGELIRKKVTKKGSIEGIVRIPRKRFSPAFGHEEYRCGDDLFILRYQGYEGEVDLLIREVPLISSSAQKSHKT